MYAASVVTYSLVSCFLGDMSFGYKCNTEKFLNFERMDRMWRQVSSHCRRSRVSEGYIILKGVDEANFHIEVKSESIRREKLSDGSP